jgi:8-oxo-dGTP pyrophosphatase MutT (NUDIX family)
MDGLTKAQVAKAEGRDLAKAVKAIRPRDAATLILIDRSGEEPKVLMGRRHPRHAFMPGKFVFPGGRTDRGDGRVAAAASLHPLEIDKLRTLSRITVRRSEAIALSAIRETYEEAGLLIGRRGAFSAPVAEWSGFAEHGVQPAVERLRFVARAITPPGSVRRFDTRFFVAWRDDVAVELPAGTSNELEEIVWLPLAEAQRADVPLITKTVLEGLEARLAVDPDLAPGGAVPFYRMIGNRFRRDVI